MTKHTLPALLALLAGCAGEPPDAEPLGDYTTWKRVDTYGNAPGHGDTYRIIYINDIAAQYQVDGRPDHDEGAIIVKEVYDRAEGSAPAPGELSVVEIMRRIGHDTSENEGWTFSAAATPTADESVQTFCWRRCHQAAPFEGAWFDYSK